jgi:hypothetical protein
MNHTRLTLLTGAVALLLGANSTEAADLAPGAPAPMPTRCEATGNSIEFRSYLPDQRRYLFVTVKTVPGIHPSVYVFFDKNFDSNGVDLSKNTDPIVAWWLDRSRPMAFTTNKIKVGWKAHGTWHYVTSLFDSGGETAVTQPIRGLTPRGDHFEGVGATDTNSFAFKLAIELPDFDGDELSVRVPSMTYDGVTVAPPEVHFTNTDEAPLVKC